MWNCVHCGSECVEIITNLQILSNDKLGSVCQPFYGNLPVFVGASGRWWWWFVFAGRICVLCYFPVIFSLGSCFYVFCLCFAEVEITHIRCWVIKESSGKSSVISQNKPKPKYFLWASLLRVCNKEEIKAVPNYKYYLDHCPHPFPSCLKTNR